MLGTFTDTGWAITPLMPAQMAPASRRALAKRVFMLEAEQAATHWLIEQIYEWSNELTDEFLENQTRLREMRAVMLNTRGHA